MFFLSKIFSRYKKRSDKISLVLSVIDGLRISDQQKAMYRESLTILDDQAVDRFYEQLQDLFEFLDQRDAIDSQKKNHETILSLRKKEESDHADDNTEFLINTI